MQLELSLHTPNTPDQEEITRFVEWLYDQGDQWLTARKISEILGLSDRKVRQFARASVLVVSSPGSPGYKHMDHCDREEFFTSNSRLDSQAKDMAARAAAERREWHRRPQRRS
jgi:hypothetical protein